MRILTTAATVVTLAMATISFSGCDNKEEVLDIETPQSEVEVERDRDTGALDVNVDRDE